MQHNVFISSDGIKWKYGGHRTSHSSYASIVYFIGCPEMNRFKIGASARAVEFRLKEIQKCSPVPVEVVAIVDCYCPEYSDRCTQPTNREGYIHEELAHKRIHGEWFNITRKEAIDVAEKHQLYEWNNILPYYLREWTKGISKDPRYRNPICYPMMLALSEEMRGAA
jgi:hypothetical protein